MKNLVLPSKDIKETAKYIDYSLLDPSATEADIRRVCQEGLRFGFACVCVQPTWVKLCRRLLRDSDVKVCGVVGFPHGANLPEVKALEAALAIKNGAQELDMVLNIGALRSKDYDLVERDIRGVVKVARQRVKVKVIIETGYLNRVQQKVACHLIAKAGAEFVKTSTGFGPRGARLQDIIFLKRVTKGRLKIKVSGGIRDLESTLRFIAHGADRIGTSYGPQILRQMV